MTLERFQEELKALLRKAEEAKKRAAENAKKAPQKDDTNTLERDYDILMKPKS